MKSRNYPFVLIVCLFISLPFTSYAQDEDIFGIDTRATPKGRKSHSELGNAFRNALSNISLELSGGGMYSMGETPSIQGGNEMAEGNGWAIPVNGGIRILLFNTLSIGGGYGREMGRINPYSADDITVDWANDRYTFDKVYGTVGLVLYDARKRAKFLDWKYRKYSSSNHYMQSERKLRQQQRYPWRFVLEGEAGSIRVREVFVAPADILEGDNFYGLYLRIERDFSEYAKLFIKAGAEFRELHWMRETAPETYSSQSIQQTLPGIRLGVSLRMPGSKRCKVPGCSVVMKHLHDGIEYRGSSIFNLQNRKIGQWY